MKPRAVAFDLDGLMFNTEELYTKVGTEVLRRRGKTFTAELLNAMMGLRPPQAIAIMIERNGLSDTVEEIEAESREVFVPLLDTELATMPGLVELLAALEAAGIPKSVATSSGRTFVEDVLGRFDFLSRFEFILTAEDVGRGKPFPEIYLESAVRHGIDPAEMLVLEDSQNGCRAGVAAGALTVAVPTEQSSSHDFSGVALMADSLTDPRLAKLLGFTVI